MTHPKQSTIKKESQPGLRPYLYLVAGFFAIVAYILISLLAAAQGGGPGPEEAVPLAEEVNEGTVGPGGQHWFKFDPDPALRVEESLSLIFTPNDGNTIQYVTLSLFEADQLPPDASAFGEGEIIRLDDNPETGERQWTGWLAGGKTYYIRLLNESDFEIDYQLFNRELNRSQPEAEPEAEAEAEPETETETETAPMLGTDPAHPEPLEMGNVTRSTLKPHSTHWYSFGYVDFAGQSSYKVQDFTLFFTPDDGNRRHHVNFELFPASEVARWQRGDTGRLTNFGAGRLVSRDGDYNTGERVWRGTLLPNNTYLMAIENGSDVEIEYWLFEGDIYTPQLGPQPAAPTLPTYAQGAAPQTALALNIGLNKGRLNPGEEAWYSFVRTTFDKKKFQEMALTMIATPDDGNRIRYMTFDVFEASEVKYWSPGVNSQMNNMGAGSVVYRDTNPETGERFWQGWVVDNNRYYVQIRNGADVPMDYWLYTGDVYSPELGEPAKPSPRAAAAPGAAPTAPMDLKVGVNQGHLEPDQERWYKFTRGDGRDRGQIETIFTLVFTPDDGNRIRQINFDLLESSQLRDWAPDNRFNLVGFGKGSVVNRDGNPQTGELLWKGHVLGGDTYYMRVSNGSDIPIDYWIFPEDVIAADLK